MPANSLSSSKFRFKEIIGFISHRVSFSPLMKFYTGFWRSVRYFSIFDKVVFANEISLPRCRRISIFSSKSLAISGKERTRKLFRKNRDEKYNFLPIRNFLERRIDGVGQRFIGMRFKGKKILTVSQFLSALNFPIFLNAWRASRPQWDRVLIESSIRNETETTLWSNFLSQPGTHGKKSQLNNLISRSRLYRDAISQCFNIAALRKSRQHLVGEFPDIFQFATRLPFATKSRLFAHRRATRWK